MNFNFFGEQQAQYKVAFITGSQRIDSIENHYVKPLGIQSECIIVPTATLPKRTNKATITPEWERIEPELIKMGVSVLIITDGDYFKHITKLTKTEANLGIKISTPKFECFFAPNVRTFFYDPEGVQAKMDIAINSIRAYMEGKYIEPGKDVIHYAKYLMPSDGLVLIEEALNELHKYPELFIDIEAYSLKFWEAGLGSIAFSWSKHEGIAIFVENNPEIKTLIKNFFILYQGKKIFHNASYDVTVLLYELFMNNFNDQIGLQNGLEILHKNLHCTLVITYLATNTCAGNELGLKANVQEFLGNYAEDVKDITNIEPSKLLEYNLKDTLGTCYVWEKNYPIMVQDEQEPVYFMFMEWMKDIIQMQLTGMPLSMPHVIKAQKVIEHDIAMYQDNLLASEHLRNFIYKMEKDYVEHYNNTRKVKRILWEDIEGTITFNPNSSKQLSELLYDFIGLPILERTATKEPATGGKVLKKLLNYTEDKDIIQLLNDLIGIKTASKILEAFIPHFLNAPYCEERKCHFLFGNFILGGTVSGRLSSRNINLQQIPSNGKYASLIKDCFRAPSGYLFIGLDFDSLEDKISALTTKDPAKLQEYIDGFDGHSLRAYAYFGEQMPDIIEGDVESINSISKLYPELRQESKDPTFACTYGGTFMTMMTNLGWSEDKSKEVEARYKKLYFVSIEWVKQKIEQATIDGYVTVCFGLRVRTPILGRTLMGLKATPTEAAAEGRTAGNALGQSYCMLNSRAANAFMEGVRASDYACKILPCSQIHDASYYLIPAEPEVLKYVNDNLVKESYWQELPEIHHDVVKLGGTLGLFYPSWNKEHEVPKHSTLDEIIELGTKIGKQNYV